MAALSSFTDNFNTGVSPDAAKWTFDDAGLAGSCAIASGELQLIYGTTLAFNTDNQLTSLTTYDYTNSSVYVKLAGPATTTGNVYGCEASFRIEGSIPGAEFVGISQASDMNLSLFAGNNSIGIFYASNITFVPADHAWLRIREAAGTMYMETAGTSASNPPAPGDWTVRASITTSDLGWTSGSQCSVRLSSALLAAISPEPTPVRWDGVNSATGSSGSTFNDTRSEAATISASQTSLMAMVATRAEAATLAAGQAANADRLGAVTEAAAITTTQSSALAYTRSVSETMTLSDSYTGVQALGGDVTEVMTITESQSARGYWEKVDTTAPTVWTKVQT